MPNFAVQNIKAIKGKQKIEQLSIDNVFQLDEFENDLVDTTYKSEFTTMISYMEFVANLRTLPKTIFRELKTKKNDSIKEYELKTKHLRVYMVQKTGGKLVVVCGYKNNQDADIRRLRSLKKQISELL